MNDRNLSLTETEAAPLVPTEHARNSYRTRLGDPTALYEIETTEQFAEQNKPKTSNFSTMMHLLKGNIGTGILAMPKAVSNAGLLVGSVGIPILGVICVHCMHILVNSSKQLARKIGRNSLDYSGTAEYAFLHGPLRFQRFSKVARFAVNLMLMLTQFGFCCVYFLFVAKSIHAVVHSLTHEDPITIKEYMLILLPFMIVYNFVPNLEKLAPASIFANVLQIVGLSIVFYYVFSDTLPSIDSVPMTAPIGKLPLYFGTAMYAFEGIGVVLPLENAMQTPEDFTGKFGVLNTGMVIVACLYTGIGFYGYLQYGSKIQSSITFNITAPIVGEVVRLFFAIAIFLSYALQLYVPLEIIWPFLKKKFSVDRYSSKKQLIVELSFRAVLVIITFALAELIPLLDLFISLVGALASSSLALIFPPIIDFMVIDYSNISRKWLAVIFIKNFLIMFLGIFGCIVGTYTSINEIVYCLKNMTACESS